MIRSRSPKRIVAFTARCSSQSSARRSSSFWCSAARAASWPSESSCSTSARRSERRSISSLISSRVLISLPQRRSRRSDSRIALAETKLVEPALVDPEGVGELVEDGDADLRLELGRVGEGGDERAAEDRDLVRQELVRLTEPEEVGIVRIHLLDDDGDVAEAARELRRQLVERPADVLLEPREVHPYRRSGRCLATR